MKNLNRSGAALLAAVSICTAPAYAGALESVTAASGVAPGAAARAARDRTRPLPVEQRVRTANRNAVREATSDGFVNAVQVFPYSEGALYRLLTAPERVSDIALQPGEAIVSVAAGDTARWTVGDTTSGNGASRRVHVLVKPFTAGLSTNLVITTDRRTYHLQLESTVTTAMTAIAWTYSGDELLAINRREAHAAATEPVATGLDIERLNFAYTIRGDRPAWRPLRAFDDGRQTYIEFAPDIAQGEVPPLFLMGATGKAELVNYRMSGRFYVVDRLFDAAELRLGAKKQQVVRVIRREKR